MSEFTYEELEVELLPSREALGFFHTNWAGIAATNVALAQNVGSVNSAAWAAAGQAIWVNQQ